MATHNIPDWVSAVVSIVCLVGLGVGVYGGVTNALTELKTAAETKHIEIYNRLQEGYNGQALLLSQVSDNRNKITVLEVKTDSIEKGQEKLAQSLDALTVELRNMNRILIKLDTINGVANAKEGTIQEGS